MDGSLTLVMIKNKQIKNLKNYLDQSPQAYVHRINRVDALLNTP